MCGIAGFVPKGKEITKRDYRTLLQLTLGNESRGRHSTGMSLMKKSGNVKIYKNAETASTFIPKHIDKYEEGLRSIISHTRHATVGKTTKKNAHPFNYGAVIGVHNGSVDNYLKISEQVDVDSQVIFQQLAKHNNNFKKVFKELVGQFAIAWQYKREPEAVYIVRKDNPLFFVQTAGGYFFSSQESLLSVLFFDRDVTIKEIKENRVIRITPKGFRSFKAKFKKEKIVLPDQYYEDKGYYGRHLRGKNDDVPDLHTFDKSTREECKLCASEFFLFMGACEKCDNCGAFNSAESKIYSNGSFYLCGDCLSGLEVSEEEQLWAEAKKEFQKRQEKQKSKEKKVADLVNQDEQETLSDLINTPEKEGVPRLLGPKCSRNEYPQSNQEEDWPNERYSY